MHQREINGMKIKPIVVLSVTPLLTVLSVFEVAVEDPPVVMSWF